MKKVKKPNLIGYDLYNKCVEGTKLNRVYYESIALLIMEAECEYISKALDNKLYDISRRECEVDKALMKYLYEGRMVPEGSPGRKEYSELRSISSDICPYCNQRKHDTLDHFLPKSQYPALAVLPLNLIPSCGKCNKDKLSYIPLSHDDTTFHPYYDDFGEGRWLEAEVVQSLPMAITFRVIHPNGWSRSDYNRTLKHFTAYHLSSLYTSHSARHLTSMKVRLIRLFDAGGETAIKDYLYEEFFSFDKDDSNHWRTAMMKALHESEWFRSVGFNSISDPELD